MPSGPTGLRARVYAALEEHDSDYLPSTELCDLLADWWEARRTRFPTRMEAWKAWRIDELTWRPPVVEFVIERHPGMWDRRQRWEYDFSDNIPTLVHEWSPPRNPRYTKKDVEADARGIVDALLAGRPHDCLTVSRDPVRIWLGRLPRTRPVAYDLPHRTARGRQDRLKAEVARLMEEQGGFERDPVAETRGSLVYRRVSGG